MTEAAATLRRFPFALASATIAAIAGILWAGDPGAHEVWAWLLIVASLGIPLFVALRLSSERGRDPRLWLFPRLVGVGLLGLLFVLWQSWSDPVRLFRYLQLSVGLHLLVAFLPYARPGEINGFWQFNRSLFLRFLLAALYSAVLFIGLAIALVAIDNLFGLDVDGDTYLRLLILIGFVFNTWFFLGGVPRDLSALDSVTEYPRGLKLFSQFVLIPIVTVYLVILTTYFAKVVLTTEWPSGWIGWLVSCVSVVGILSILLVQPIRDRPDSRWMGTYSRWFWIVLLPSIVMLLLAIWKRVDQYGVTEPRYFLIVGAVWLLAMAVVFGLRRSENIKLIPATLCFVAFVTLLGPWGAYSVSLSSQVSRLQGLLTTSQILQDGRVVPATGDVSFEDRKEIAAVLNYLAGTHGLARLNAWFGGELATIDTVTFASPSENRWGASEHTQRIMRWMQVPYVEQWEEESPEFRNYFALQVPDAIPIDGYDYTYVSRNWRADTVWVGDRRLRLEFVDETSSIRVFEIPDEEDAVAGGAPAIGEASAILIEFSLLAAAERARAHPREASGQWAIPPSILRIDAENERIRLTFIPQSLNVQIVNGEPTINSFNGTYYFSLKPEPDAIIP